MLAGNTKLLLGHTTYSFLPSTPYLIEGQNISIETKKRVSFVTNPFANETISMKLKILFVD